MRPPARLPPVQAWALVDEAGLYGAVYFDPILAAYKCRVLNLALEVDRYAVQRVTVRAWAPPTRKKVK